MASREIAFEFPPFPFRTYTDGSFERTNGDVFLPPSPNDPSTGVASKDVAINTDITARLYLPSKRPAKLPLLLYFHGGGFCIESPFSQYYHPYLNSLAASAGVLAVSVHYRRVLEEPIDTCYEDSHAALRWVVSLRCGGGGEEWINEHADLHYVYLMGDSAGANIAHHVAMRAGREGLDVAGLVLVQPYFWGRERLEMDAEADPEQMRFFDEFWDVICPGSELGNDDPRMNVVRAGGLEGLRCRRVLVCVGGKDALRGRGWEYHHAVCNSGWRGETTIWEAPGEGHIFHLFDPSGCNARRMMRLISSFLHAN